MYLMLTDEQRHPTGGRIGVGQSDKVPILVGGDERIISEEMYDSYKENLKKINEQKLICSLCNHPIEGNPKMCGKCKVYYCDNDQCYCRNCYCG